jgi:thioesterase domain-containing protein
MRSCCHLCIISFFFLFIEIWCLYELQKGKTKKLPSQKDKKTCNLGGHDRYNETTYELQANARQLPNNYLFTRTTINDVDNRIISCEVICLDDDWHREVVRPPPHWQNITRKLKHVKDIDVSHVFIVHQSQKLVL